MKAFCSVCGSSLFGGEWMAFRASTNSTSEASVDEDDRPPICPRCGVTMVLAALSAETAPDAEWVCLECEEPAEEA